MYFVKHAPNFAQMRTQSKPFQSNEQHYPNDCDQNHLNVAIVDKECCEPRSLEVPILILGVEQDSPLTLR